MQTAPPEFLLPMENLHRWADAAQKLQRPALKAGLADALKRHGVAERVLREAIKEIAGS
jgi:hypothetical protein